MMAEQTTNEEQSRDSEDVSSSAALTAIEDGESARFASLVITEQVMAMMRGVQLPPELQSAIQLYEQKRPQTPARRFQDVSTGMRLCYMEWGSGEEVVLLLHDAAESAIIWHPVASRLADSSYRVFALDLRGHGGSTWSSDHTYTAQLMADEVESFVLEKDLYVRPVGVVGLGVGGAVALAFAGRNPRLVGALALLEYTPYIQQPHLAFHPLQAAAFGSYGEMLKMMLSPAWTHPQREVRGALRSAHAMARSTDAEGLAMCMDPRWHFVDNPDKQEQAAAVLQCHVLLLHGQHSHVVRHEDVQRLMQHIGPDAKSKQTVMLPEATHFMLTDFTSACFNILSVFLDVTAAGALLMCNKETRRPELLGIRPLPQYSSLEEALQALKPRAIPTKQAIDAELLKLKIDAGLAGDDASDSDDGHNPYQTALAKDPSDYFGFVG